MTHGYQTAAIGKTAVALEMDEELDLIPKPTVHSSTRTSYASLCRPKPALV
jgi:hypothetical protein